MDSAEERGAPLLPGDGGEFSREPRRPLKMFVERLRSEILADVG